MACEIEVSAFPEVGTDAYFQNYKMSMYHRVCLECVCVCVCMNDEYSSFYLLFTLLS